MPHQHICRQAKANISKKHKTLTLPRLYNLRCIYIRYTSQVIRAHVSFGSQFQKCPHADFAHIDPDSMPKVRNATPIYTSVSAADNRSPEVWKSLTTPIRKAHPNNEYENIYTVTWGMNHGLWRAGISVWSCISGFRTFNRMNTVESTVENDKIHL